MSECTPSMSGFLNEDRVEKVRRAVQDSCLIEPIARGADVAFHSKQHPERCESPERHIDLCEHVKRSQSGRFDALLFSQFSADASGKVDSAVVDWKLT